MNDTIVTDPATTGRRIPHWVSDDRVWLAAALAMNLLLGWGGEEASSLAWLNPLLFVPALAIRFHDVRRGALRWQLTGWRGAAAVIAMGWAVGMVVESTIAAGGDGYGGMHADTGPSFILAQGYYIPAAAITWVVVRRYGLDVRRAFFFAGTMAWWETLTLGAISLVSPPFVHAPFLIAYYFSTYALCGMAGLLVVDPKGIASRRPRSISNRRLLALGTFAGACSWAVFMLWAVSASHLFGFAL